MRSRSIRNHLIMSLALGLGTLIALAGVGVYAFVDESLERGMDAALAARADTIIAAVHVEDGRPQLQLGEASTLYRGDQFYYRIWHADGRQLASSASLQDDDTSIAAFARSGRRTSDTRLADGKSVRAIRVKFTARTDEDDEHPAKPGTEAAAPEQLAMVVAMDRQSIDRPLAILLTGLLIAAALVLTGIVAIVTWGVRRGLRPLADMGRLADQISASALSVRFPATHAIPAELLPIATKLNDLFDRLQAAFDRERQFTAAIAHELRTPVAELRSLCDVVLRWPDGNTAIEALRDASDIAGDMSAAVENLMLLARCQAGVERLRSEAVTLVTAVQVIWPWYENRARERELDVSFELDGVTVLGDSRALAIVFRNLIENAVAYATPGGAFRVHAEQRGDCTVVRFGNTTAGLTAADLPRLSDAFWKKDAARTTSGHAGLGLSIVDAYCRQSGIRVDTTLGPDDWLNVTLTFNSHNATG